MDGRALFGSNYLLFSRICIKTHCLFYAAAPVCGFMLFSAAVTT